MFCFQGNGIYLLSSLILHKREQNISSDEANAIETLQVGINNF